MASRAETEYRYEKLNSCGPFNQPTCKVVLFNDLRSSEIQAFDRDQGLTLVGVSNMVNGFDLATSQHHELCSQSVAALHRVRSKNSEDA